MSDSIQERIVRMVFDNAKFESGIKQSSESLASFEDKLNNFFRGNHDTGTLEGAIDGIADAADEAGGHFDLLNAVGSAALLSLAKTAANVAADIASNLANFTINFETENAQIGMSKYEQQVEATQKIVNTIRENTNGVMESVESAMTRVTPVVQTLQKYADETSYKMSDMTTALGMFTGAGIDLKTAEKAIMGVANWAAISGINANQAGRAFQNISQAMSKNALLYEDMQTFQWMGMGTPEFKKTVIEAAKQLGTIREAGEGIYEVVGTEKEAKQNGKKVREAATFTVDTFEKELSKRWANRKVLEKVFGEMYGTGFWDETGKQIYDSSLGSRAFAAGQEAKTWTDAWEAMRESATSSWAQTWEYIYGNYAEAVKLWTPVANAMINVVGIVGNVRNAFAQIFHDRGGQQWLVDMASKLEDVTSGWVDFADEVLVALGLVDKSADETSKSVSTTAGELTGDLAKMSEMAKKNAEEVRGYIDTGTVKMKPGTKQTFNDLANAWDDLDTYLNSGSVDADVLAQKLDNINKLTDQASKTNKLMKFKKNGLLGMIKELGSLKYGDEEITKANQKSVPIDEQTAEAAEEANGELTKAQKLADRLRPIMENVKSGQGIVNAAIQAGKDNLPKFSQLLSIMGDRYLRMAENITRLIPRISEFLSKNNILGKGLSFILDKMILFTGTIAKVKSVLSTFKRAAIDGIFDFLNSDTFSKFKDGELSPLLKTAQEILDLGSEIINLGVTEFMENVNSIAGSLRKNISGFLTDFVSSDAVTRAIVEIETRLEGVKSWLTGLRDEIKKRGFLTTIVSRVSAGLKQVSAGFDKFRNNLEKNILSLMASPEKTLKKWQSKGVKGVQASLLNLFSPKGAVSKGVSFTREKLNGFSKSLRDLQLKYIKSPEIFRFIGDIRKRVKSLSSGLKKFQFELDTGIFRHGLKQKTTALITSLKSIHKGVKSFLKDPSKSLSSFGKNMQKNLGDKFADIFSPKGILAKGAGIIDGTFGSVSENLGKLQKKYKNDSDIFPFVSGLKTTVDDIRERFAKFKKELDSGVLGRKVVLGLSALSKYLTDTKKALRSFIEDPKGSLVKFGAVLKDKFIKALSPNGIASKALGYFSTQLGKAQTYFAGLKEKLSSNPTALKVVTWLEDKIGKVKTRFDELKSSFDKGDFISAITSKFTAFKKQLDQWGIAEKLKTIKQWFDGLKLSEKLEEMKKVVSGFFSNLIADPKTALINLKDNLIAGFWDVVNQIKAFLAENFTFDKLFPKKEEGGSGISQKIFDMLGFTGEGTKTPFKSLNWIMDRQVKGWTWFENLLMGGPKEEKEAKKSMTDKVGDAIQMLFGIQSAVAEEYDFGENPLAAQEKKGNFFDSLSLFISNAASSLGSVFDKANPVFQAISTGQTLSAIKSMVSDVALMTGKKKEGSALKSVGDMLKNLAIAIGAFVVGALVLSLIPTDKLAGNLIALGIFIGGLVGVAALTKKFKLDNIGTMLEKVGQGLLSMATSILVMVANIALLSNMSWGTFVSGMLKAVIIIGAMMGAVLLFAKMFKTSDMAKGKMLGDVVKELANAIGIMTGALVVLGALPFKNAVQGLVAIGLMLAGLTASIILIGRFSKDPKAIEAAAKAISSIGNAIKVMTASIVILGNMAPEKLIQGGIALAGMLISMIVMMKIADKISRGVSFANLFAFAIAFGGVAVAFGVAMSMVKGMDWQSIAAFSAGLSVSMVALAVAMKIISTIPVAGAAQGGAGVAVIIGIIAGIVAIAGAINQLTKGKALELMESGGELLETIGKSFGKFFGGIAAGVMDAASGGLTSVASNLSSFSSIAGPFFNMIGGLDTSKLGDFTKFLGDVIKVGAQEGTSSAAKNIGDIGGALASYASTTKGLNGQLKDSKAAKTMSEHIKDIVKNLSGEDGSKLGNTKNSTLWIARIGAAIKLYGKSISAVPEMDAQQTLGKAEQVSKFVNYIIQNINGPELETSIDDFPDSSKIAVLATDLVALAGAITDFADAAKDINTEQTQKGTDLLDYFAGLQEKLTPVGGVMEWFKGKRESLGEFATDIQQLTGAMGTFVTEANKIKDDKKLETAKGLLDYFAQDLEPSLKNVGGLVSWVIGDSDLGTFGQNIGELGAGLHTFVGAIQGEDGKGKLDKGAVDLAVSTLGALNEINNALPTTGGLFQLITGGKSLGTFGKQLPDVGEGLKGLFDAFKMEDGNYDVPKQEDISRITGALKAFQGINTALTDETGAGLDAALEKLLGISNLDNLGDFSSTLPNVGKNLSAFSKGFDSELKQEDVSNAATALSTFANAAKGLPDDTSTTIEKFLGLGDMHKLGEFSENFPKVAANLSGFVNGFEGVTLNQSDVTNAATALSTFATAAKGLPEDTSSTLEKFLGLGDMGKLGEFSNNFPTVAKNLIAFVQEFEGQTFDTGVVQNAGDAISILSSVAKALPEEQNILDKIFSGDNSLKGFTSQLSGVGGDLAGFSKQLQSINYGAANGAIALIKSIADLAVALADDTNWSTGLAQITQFIWDMVGSESISQAVGSFAAQVVTSMAGQIDTDVNKAAIQTAIGNLFTIDTSQLNSAPTISPVLDLSHFDATNQMGTLFEVSGLSSQISAAITFDSIGLSPITDKLDGIGGELVSFKNANSSDLSSIHSNISGLYSQIASLENAINSIELTVNTADFVSPINKGLGRQASLNERNI